MTAFSVLAFGWTNPIAYIICYSILSHVDQNITNKKVNYHKKDCSTLFQGRRQVCVWGGGGGRKEGRVSPLLAERVWKWNWKNCVHRIARFLERQQRHAITDCIAGLPPCIAYIKCNVILHMTWICLYTCKFLHPKYPSPPKTKIQVQVHSQLQAESKYPKSDQNLLLVLHARLKCKGDQAFSAVGPQLWSNLLLEILAPCSMALSLLCLQNTFLSFILFKFLFYVLYFLCTALRTVLWLILNVLYK